MIYNEYEGIRIAAISSAVSPKVIDIHAMMEDPNEDPKYLKTFIRNTGITQKHVAVIPQTASDFAFAAAKLLEEKGRYNPEEIGVLVYVTQNPDYRTPSTAHLLHKRLGLDNNCMAFDVNLGCSGFVYGVSVGASMLSTSTATKALVLMGDTQARGRKDINQRSFNTRLLFGDASSAILLEKKEGFTLRSGLMSDGSGHKAISTPYGAWRHPEGPELTPGDDIEVFNFTLREVPPLIQAFLEKVGGKIEDYDALVLHQANMMILKNIAKRVKLPFEKCPVSIDRYGNTSSASIPVSIVDRYGPIEEDRELNLITSGFGIGLSWGVLDFKIHSGDIYPMIETDVTYDDGYRPEGI